MEISPPADQETTVIQAPETYFRDNASELEQRIAGALGDLGERLLRSEIAAVASLSEARIIRALDLLENRLSHPVASKVPDLVVLERVDQLEAKITNLIDELNSRWSAKDLGEVELKVKAEVSEKLREIAVHLNETLTSLQHGIHNKLDAYHRESTRRLEQLEARFGETDPGDSASMPEVWSEG